MSNTPYKSSSHDAPINPISFAQTVSFMPSNTTATSYASPEYVNINFKNPNANAISTPKFHGIPTSHHQWFRGIRS